MSTNDTPREEALLSKDAEARLFEAGRKVFRNAYPNPDRSHRIDSAALKEAAQRSHREPLPPELVDELTWSSETFAEYERYLREARFARKMRYLAACAGVLMAIGAASWWFIQPASSPEEIVREEPSKQMVPAPEGPSEDPQASPAPQAVYDVAVLDLRDQSQVRSEQPTEVTPPGEDLPVLPARRVYLTVYLPIGSEDGEYELTLVRARGEPLQAASGQAALVNQNVVLKVRMDLTALDLGEYLVGVRRGEFPWAYYRLRIQ